MLSCQQKLAKRLVKLRSLKSLSQRQVAVEAGFTQAYLAQVECGVRPVSWKSLGKLERIYGKQLNAQMWKGIGQPGRPRLQNPTRAALAELGVAIGDFCAPAEVRSPKHVQLHQVRRSSDPLWPMALHLGQGPREEVELLEQLRAEDERFWRQFNSLRFDSWSEKRLLVRLGLLGGQWVGVRLKRLGCSLNVVDGKTGGRPGLHRAFILKGEQGSLAWSPQVAVNTDAGVFCLDNLLVVSTRGRRVTVAVEMNGSQFHQDRGRQRWRDRALGIPVLHVDAGELDRPALITRILRWAYQQALAA